MTRLFFLSFGPTRLLRFMSFILLNATIMLILFATQSVHALISDGANATDVIGQYTTTGGFTNSYTNSTANNSAGAINAISFNAPNDIAMDTIHHRLFVVDRGNHRVLVFNLNSSNQLVDKTADNVLGQATFLTGTLANSQSGFNDPTFLAYDGVHDRLFVSNAGNDTVRVFDVASITDGESAINVIGDTTFTGSTAGTSQSELKDPQGLAYDGINERLFVSDDQNNRVMIFNVNPTVLIPNNSATDGPLAINELGQVDFNTGTASVSQTGFSNPRGLYYDSTNSVLYVAQTASHRVTTFDLTSITNGEAATHVLGQANFTTSASATSTTGMASPQGVVYDNTTNTLYVAQATSNRVTTYDLTVFNDGEAATHVLGQPDFVTSTAGTTQAKMNVPRSFMVDSTNGTMYVAQTGAHRITIYDISVFPTVTNVTSSTVDGSYNAGDVVSIQVTFSGAVTVTGVPQLTLETGATDAIVNYASGSGTTTLTFTYTIASGETSSDLDYLGTTALSLNGGTIQSASLTNAILTLPTPSAAGSLGANKAIVVDTTAPSVPGVPDMTPGTDLGSSSLDDTTSDNTPSFTVSCETGATVELFNGATSLGTGTCVASTVTITASAIVDSTLSITAVQTDVAGNISVASSGLSVTIDTVADASTGTPNLDAGNDTGSSATDDITNSTTPSFTLSCVTGSVVTLYDSVTSIGNGTCVGGTVTITSSALSSGTHAFINAKQTDLAGNTSVASSNLSVTVDTTSPAASYANDVEIGPLNSDVVQITITETNPDTSLQVYAFSSDAVCNASDFSGGEPTFSSGVGITIATEANNTKYFCAHITDLAGNSVYVMSSQPFNIDRTAPLIVFTDDVALGPVGVDTVSATVTDVNPDTSTYRYGFISDAVCDASDDAVLTNMFTGGGSFSFTDTVETENGNYVCVKAADLVGNITYNVSYLRSTNVLNVDNTPPDVPDLLLPANGAFLSSGTITFSGQIDEPSASNSPSTIRVYIDADSSGTYNVGDTLVCTTTVSDDGDGSLLEANQPWGSCTTGVALTEGIYTVYVESEDPFNNISTRVASSLTVDTTSPVLTLPDSVVAGPIQSDTVTVVATETNPSTGTYLYTYSTDAVCNASDFTGGESAFTTGLGITFVTEVNNGKYFCARASDAAGNTSYVVSANPFNIDVTPSTIPNVTSSTANGSYNAGDLITIQVTFNEVVTVTGVPQLTLETGATDAVANYVSGSGTSTLTFTYVIASGENSIDLDFTGTSALALNGGNIQDLALNNATLTLPVPGAVGSLGINKAIIVDTTVPSAPGTPDMSSASDTGTSSTDNLTGDTTPDFTISCTTGETVELYDNLTLIGSAVCAGGSVTITSSALSNGIHANIHATQTDAAGNVSVAGSDLSITIDTSIVTVTPSPATPNVGGGIVFVGGTGSGSSLCTNGINGVSTNCASTIPTICSFGAVFNTTTGLRCSSFTNSNDFLGNGKQCSADMLLTQNMKAGARDGKYNTYTQAVAKEVAILQRHMERLGFDTGKIDGILGKVTDGAIKRMQKYLGTKQDGFVGPITRALINKSCN